MATERLGSEELERLVEVGLKWFSEGREEHRPYSHEISPEEKDRLRPFFGDVVDRFREREVDGIVVPEELHLVLPKVIWGAWCFIDTNLFVPEYARGEQIQQE